ncbi:MAG TPA: 50S ribosomal protein L5 [Thermoplasmata archaeon]|nr:50S ribosomal protein L5 [Thermoplasmata archaeon]
MSAPTATVPPIPPPALAGNRWRQLRVVKLVVNIGVGESGDRRAKAEKVLTMLAQQKPVATRSHATNRDFGIREGQEIGVKVTLRRDAAVEFLRRAFEARDRQIDPDSIDRDGNFSFGIRDYTDFTGMKYDPGIGIFGLDISVEIGRAGWRVRDRRTRSTRLPPHARVTSDETRKFLVDQFGVTLLE